MRIHARASMTLWVFCSLWILSISNLAGSESFTQNNTAQSNSTRPYPIFGNGLPEGAKLTQEGALSPKEGLGSYTLFSYPKENIQAVIVDIEKLGWVKVAQLKSANPLIVSRHLLSRFYPTQSNQIITRHDGINLHEQIASHLLITDQNGKSEPAITLRILFPKGRAVFLLMQQQNSNFAASYQLQEGLAQQLMDALYIPNTSQISENLILLRLRQIFKNGVFTHRASSSSKFQ